MKNYWKKLIGMIKEDDRVGALLKIFFFFLLTVVLATVLYEEMPLLIKYSVLGQDSFYAGLITNMYNSAIDFLVFSIVLFVLMSKKEKRDQIKLYKENIDDSRFWFSDAAAFKNHANIRRLQELGVTSIDISKCTLASTKPKKIKLINSRAMGACLDHSNFDKSVFIDTNFQGATAKFGSFNEIDVQTCNFKYFKLVDAQMKSSRVADTNFTKAQLDRTTFYATVFKNCNFEGASLDGCTFERADMRGAIGLTAEQLLKCASIKYAKIDEDLADEIFEASPNFIKRRPMQLSR